MKAHYRLPSPASRTVQDFIIAEVLDGLANNELFCDEFCRDCYDGGAYRSRDIECPAGYDFTDEKRCSRSSDWVFCQDMIAGGIISALKH